MRIRGCGGAKLRQWLVVGIAAVVLAGCNEDKPLKISGEPATSIAAGADYSFQPEASAPRRESLTFSIENMPVWATFDATTGELTGKPTSAHAGMYANILIAVTDGTETVALPAFSIDVMSAADGSATLSWVPPTQNADGSVLTNLAGYRIFYGTDPDALSQEVELTNPGLTRYVVENLSPATWYFAMQAFNSKSEESAQIGTVSISIP